jgi:ring-opening amidohydrolase-like protein
VPEPIEVRKVPLRHVSDASGLAELIDSGVMEADRVVAVIGKTEGNGGVNDYTRIIADRAFREVLVARGTRGADEVARVPIVWSGGTDGVLSPHATIFATVAAQAAPATDEPRLTVGFAMSEQLLPEDIGRTAMVTKVAEAVIDKDLGAALLARTVDADVLVIATDVPHAVLHYGTPQAADIGTVTVAELRAYAAEGHFASGSMGPKVDAACRFVEHGGTRAIITDLANLSAAVHGDGGTVVVPDDGA